MESVKIFSGRATGPLSQRIAESYGQPLGGMETRQFSDGEISVYFTESVRGCSVFLIQSTNAPADNLMEMLLMIDAAKRASAKYVTVVMPYFGYARQDRKDKPRVAIAAKLIANLIQAAGANRIMTCDLHAGQIQGFFDIPLDHLDASSIFMPYIKSLELDNVVFAAPDVGSTGRARSYAKRLGTEMVICDKYRKRANEIESMQLIGDVTGMDVVLVDDMVDTAGTICRASELLMERGAKSVRAVCTHALLSKNAIDKINASPMVSMIVTDTIPVTAKSDKLQVVSVDDLFAKAIRRIHNHESISSLFI